MILHDVKVHPSKDDLKRPDQLAWKIHQTGKAVAAVRPKDEAEAAVHALHGRKISASLARA